MAQIKCGVLTFGYDDASLFRDSLERKGYYSINLGDNAQSIAIKHAYRQLGFSEDLFVSINRDTLSRYRGDLAYLIMNGVFGPPSFPLPPNIIPIFVGFNADESVIRQHADLFRRHQPIGCRDDATTALMQSLGIRAETTGCLTLTLPKRNVAPAEPKLLIVYGTMKGRLPGSVLRFIPPELADTAEFIFHRLPMTNFPPSEQQRADAEKYEQALLDYFRNEATLVLTPLHHVASPCMAMGIPVIVCRRKLDPRFSFLQKLVPIYLPKQFKQIDWAPKAPDLTSIRDNLLSWTKEKIEAAAVAA
mgnify:CR=1 FL=1